MVGLGIGIAFFMVYIMQHSLMETYKENDSFTVASIITFLFFVGIWKIIFGKNS